MSRHVILVFLHSTPSVRFGVLCMLRLYDFLVLAMPYVHAWNLGVSCGVCASVMLRIGAALTIGPQRSEFSQTRKVEGLPSRSNSCRIWTSHNPLDFWHLGSIADCSGPVPHVRPPVSGTQI